MKWYKKQVNENSSTIHRLRRIAQSYGVRVFFTKRRKLGSGTAWNLCSRISVGIKQDYTLQDVISTFFHELCHVLNYRDHKYYTYHATYTFTPCRIDRRRKFIATALKAERYTDKRAKKLMKEYYPQVPYLPGYANTKKAREFLNEYSLNEQRSKVKQALRRASNG